MSDEAMKQVMAKFAKYAMPSQKHRILDPLVGTWDQEVSFQFAPGAPCSPSKGASVIEWTLDGRFLTQKYKGEPGEHGTFEGFGITGYDNYREEFVSVWADTMATSFQISRGQYDSAGRIGEFHGTHDDWMGDRRDRPHRTVTTIESRDRNRYEMFVPGPDGKEFRCLEVVSTRKAGAQL